MAYAEFPSREKLYTDTQRIDIFKQLQKESLKKYCNNKPVKYPNIRLNNIDYLYHGKYHYLIYEPHKYRLYMLSDLFNDHCRAQCKFNLNLSPTEYYGINRNKVIESLQRKKKEVTPLNIREEIYLLTKECSIHNPLIIKYFINKFSAKKILDFSAGWGDRLIGAMLAGVDVYSGFDPNSCLQEGYQSIIKLFLPYSSNPNGSYSVTEARFEDAVLPKGILYDLVYTSPPYFELETYTDEPTQSTYGTKTQDDWLKNFLYVAIDKCMNSLADGGRIILYFSQKVGDTYMEKFMAWAKRHQHLYYIGNMFYSNPFLKDLHPIFIFKKSMTIPIELYNPPIEIIAIEDNSKKLYVVRDDLLVGGTKSRAIVQYIQQLLEKNPKTNELVYAGASNGYAQIALSYALYLMKSNIKLTIFFQATHLDEAHKLKRIAKYLYPNTNYIDVNGPLKKLWKELDQYMLLHKNAYPIKFGLDDPIFMDILLLALKDHLEKYVDKIKRLWLVAGSGTLLKTLYGLLPNTKFNIVQVGRPVDISSLDKNRVTLYVSGLPLYTKIDADIPYPTTKSYDGKIWEFSDKFENKDFIWNTAGIASNIYPKNY